MLLCCYYEVITVCWVPPSPPPIPTSPPPLRENTMVRVQPKVMGFIAGVLVISALLVLFNAIYSGGRGNSFTGVQVWHPPETSLNAEDEVGVVIKSVKPDKQGLCLQRDFYQAYPKVIIVALAVLNFVK